MAEQFKENTDVNKDENVKSQAILSKEITMTKDGQIIAIGDMRVEDLSYPAQMAAQLLGMNIEIVISYKPSDDEPEGIYPTLMSELFDEIRNKTIEEYQSYMIANLIQLLHEIPELDRLTHEYDKSTEK